MKYSDHSKFTLKYYAFDVDDNLLMLSTKIHMEKRVGDKWVMESVSTEKFREVRNKKNWRPAINAYEDFRDDGSRGMNAFFEDVVNSISNKRFGPSWEQFIECITNGSIFSIITARGHNPVVIRRTVKYIIYNILTAEQRNCMCANLMAYKDLFEEDFDILEKISIYELVDDYLDSCDFIGVSSPYFLDKHPEIPRVGLNPANPEHAKQVALNDFINRIDEWCDETGVKATLGFSDDDPRNVQAVIKYFNEIFNIYDIDFIVYDTSKPEIKGGVKTKIS